MSNRVQLDLAESINNSIISSNAHSSNTDGKSSGGLGSSTGRFYWQADNFDNKSDGFWTEAGSEKEDATEKALLRLVVGTVGLVHGGGAWRGC